MGKTGFNLYSPHLGGAEEFAALRLLHVEEEVPPRRSVRRHFLDGVFYTVARGHRQVGGGEAEA